MTPHRSKGRFDPVSGTLATSGSTIELLGFHLIPIPRARDVVTSVGRAIAGRGFSPRREPPPHLVAVGDIRNNTGGHVYTCGMNTSYKSFIKQLQSVSSNYNNALVVGVYNSTEGLVSDFCRAVYEKLSGCTRAVHLVAGAWRMWEKHLPSNAPIYSTNFSEGAIISEVASKKHASPELQKRLRMINLGGGSIVDSSLAGQVDNFIDKNDLVPFGADFFRYQRALNQGIPNARFVNSGRGVFSAHDFFNPDYQAVLQKYGRRFAQALREEGR